MPNDTCWVNVHLKNITKIQIFKINIEIMSINLIITPVNMLQRTSDKAEMQKIIKNVDQTILEIVINDHSACPDSS